MVDEISLIGWRDDIGAYLIMQYPGKRELTTQDIMQIYTAHRQNTLYPNFATLNYKGKKIACGKCDSCLLRLKGFTEANLKDPIKYNFLPKWYNHKK